MLDHSEFPALYQNNLPRAVSSLVDAELEPGEQVIWAGQPVPARFARRNLGMVLFGIPWTAFALFWIAGASGFKIPDFSSPTSLFPLFGVPFVLVGCWLLSSPYWQFRQARRTAYVITDRRAVVLSSGFWNSITVRSFEPFRLGDLRRIQNTDGTGDLVFERVVNTSNRNGNQSTDHGFLAIKDVKTVETLVRQLVTSRTTPETRS